MIHVVDAKLELRQLLQLRSKDQHLPDRLRHKVAHHAWQVMPY